AYYHLCLAAHHATVASYVPTDVDNQIRFKLWDPTLSPPVVRAMAAHVESSLDWDCRPGSTRWIPAATGDGDVSGHPGEGFSTSVAAYAALRRKDPEAAAVMAGLIDGEMRRQAQNFTEFKRRGDGVSLLKTAAILAHNLGDFDRVADMWMLADDD